MINMLKLHTEIFSLDKISYTIDAFKNIAKITVTQKKDYYICVFSHCKFDIEKTICEFSNYLRRDEHQKNPS